MMKFKRFIKEESNSEKFERESAYKNKINDSLMDHPLKEPYTTDEKVHARRYINHSANINGYLWDKHRNLMKGTHFMENPTHEIQARHLDSAMKKHEAPHDFTVYSGTMHDPRAKMDAVHYVRHPAFLSTSLRKSTGEYFGEKNNRNKPSPENKKHHVLHIHVPKGQNGLYVDKVIPDNDLDEGEYILPRNLILKHEHTEEEPVIKTNSQGEESHITRFHHHMSIVPESKEDWDD